MKLFIYVQKNLFTAPAVHSRDISIPRPATGRYYLLVEAKQSFHELLITAIMDTPPGGD